MELYHTVSALTILMESSNHTAKGMTLRIKKYFLNYLLMSQIFVNLEDTIPALVDLLNACAIVMASKFSKILFQVGVRFMQLMHLKLLIITAKTYRKRGDVYG